MKTRKINNPLLESLTQVSYQWEIPFGLKSSVWPSVAGLVKPGTPVICGMGPVVKDLYTPKESVERISIIQRILLLSQHLLGKLGLNNP